MKENPDNNDIVQAMLDLRQAAAENGDTELAAQAKGGAENPPRS